MKGTISTLNKRRNRKLNVWLVHSEKATKGLGLQVIRGFWGQGPIFEPDELKRCHLFATATTRCENRGWRGTSPLEMCPILVWIKITWVPLRKGQGTIDGHVAETVNVDYPSLFANQGKQPSVFVCRKQTEICCFNFLYIYIYWNGSIEIYIAVKIYILI